MKAQERAQTTDVVWRSGWHWPDLGRVKALMIWPLPARSSVGYDRKATGRCAICTILYGSCKRPR